MPTPIKLAPEAAPTPPAAATVAGASATKAPRVPKYRLHRPSGQAVVTIAGRDRYLGSHGTPESVERYHRALAEHLAGVQRRAQAGISVAELIDRYLTHAETYYRKGGRHTQEVATIRGALRVLLPLYGRSAAADFDARAAAAVRVAMVAKGWCRGHINSQMSRVAGMFRWGAQHPEIMLPIEVWHRARTLAPLKRGRCDVRESEPVRPVDDAIVDATLPKMSRQARALIELQRLTGARSGELVVMRTGDIDASGETWTYTPASHKTEHHGHARSIFLGPRAIAVVRPFLRKNLAEYLFQPVEAEADRSADRRSKRRTPMTPSQRARDALPTRPGRAPSDHYTTESLRRAIVRACDAAFRPPADLDDADRQRWIEQHRWHPHQLRHAAATRIRREHGLEAARVILGHRGVRMTEHYSDVDNVIARRIASVAG